MLKEDWYRNKKWDSSIRDHFFEKLSRAQSQRDQYLAIQAGVLNSNGYYKEAIELINLYFETRKEEFHDHSALVVKAGALFKLKQIKESIVIYHQLIVLDERRSSIDSGYRIVYPYIVATNELEEEYGFALEVLEQYKKRDVFPLQQFMRYAAEALINKDREAASIALDTAQVKKSGMRYHQKLGLVGKEHRATIHRLIRIKEGSFFNQLKKSLINSVRRN